MSPIAPRPVRAPLGVLASVVLAAALLAGCGSGSDTAAKDDEEKATTTVTEASNVSTTRASIDPDSIKGGEQAYVDAMVPMISGGTGLSDADAERAAKCLAPKWVAIIGVDGFAAAGVAPEDFSELDGGLETLGLDRAQATEMVAGFEACEIDLRAASLAQIAADPAVTAEMRTCLDQAITVESVEAGLIANLIGEESENPSSAAAQACFETGG